MKKFYIIGFLVLMSSDTLTQCSIKLASLHAGEMTLTWNWMQTMLHQYWLYLAVTGYVCSFLTWMTIIKHAPVGPAFAASHLAIVSVLIVSVLCLGESLARLQILGCLLILGGIALLGMETSDEHHAPAPDCPPACDSL